MRSLKPTTAKFWEPIIVLTRPTIVQFGYGTDLPIILLITVKERTREFGIRKALGAKPLSILWLIIVESVTITTIFGYIGMVAGIGATEWMNNAFGNQTMDTGMWTETVFLNPTVDTRIAIQATLTLIIAGTLAGLFPARKAVSIRPIEALRAD